VLLGSVLGTSGTSAAVAEAAASVPPVPAVPTFTSEPEALAHYEAGDTCDPVDKPGATKLANLIRQTYGSDQVIGISSRADCAALPSEHAEGRALDWMLNASNAKDFATAKTFLRWLLARDAQGNRYAMARRLGVMYIIWNRRMWRAYDPSRGWAPYTGSVPHTDHIHISLSLDGASGRTSFWTDHTLPGPCVNGVSGGPSTPSRQPALYVPVEPTRVLVTSTGRGTAGGSPCRLWSDGERVDATVTGVAGLPATGVEAVALSVAAGPSNTDASLTAWPTGATGHGLRQLTLDRNRRSTSLMVVPVGADGRVSFWTSRGATDLTVSVVGYYVDASTPGLKRTASGAAGQFHRTSQPDLFGVARLAAATTRVVDVSALAGLPADATAAVVTLTAASGDAAGTVLVTTHGATLRSAPGVIVGPRQRRTVTAIVPIGPDGRLDVVNRSKTTMVVNAHLVGFYAPAAVPGGLLYRWRLPRRVVSTAQDVGLPDVVHGVASIDLSRAVGATVRAVVLQVTVTGGARGSRLGFFDPDGTNPLSPDVSVGAHETVTTTVVAPISATGSLALWDAGGRVRLTASVIGTFATP
jgi:hypothetical protein